MSQVNLLPPELRARQKTKQQTILILGAGVAVLVLLLGYWFLQSQKLSDVNEQVAAQNATNTQIQAQIDQLQQFQQLQVEAASQEALLASAYAGEVSFSQMLMDVSRTIPSDAYLNAFNAALTAAGGRRGAHRDTHDELRGLLHGRGGADGFDSLASWLTRLESVKGWVNPWLSSAAETGPNTGLYAFTSGVDLTQDVLTPRGREGESSGG